MDELKQDILTCSMCTELFDDPRMLPCQHTFCRACLTTYIYGERRGAHKVKTFTCPLCRERVKMDSEAHNVCCFPSNITIVYMLNKLNRTIGGPAQMTSQMTSARTNSLRKPQGMETAASLSNSMSKAQQFESGPGRAQIMTAANALFTQELVFRYSKELYAHLLSDNYSKRYLDVLLNVSLLFYLFISILIFGKSVLLFHLVVLLITCVRLLDHRPRTLRNSLKECFAFIRISFTEIPVVFLIVIYACIKGDI